MRESGERDQEPPLTPVPVLFSEVIPVAVGTAVWALLFVIGLFLRDTLVDDGRGWWVWSAAAGIVLGLFGCVYLRRRQVRLLARVRSVSEPAKPRTPDQS